MNSNLKYMYFLDYFVVKWYASASILFSAACFEIRQCNSDMKIETNSVNALSIYKLL